MNECTFPFSATCMHIFTRYLFSHTLLSATLAGPFLIFMPVDAFTPASQAETSVIHLLTSFKEVLITLVSCSRAQGQYCFSQAAV